MNEPPLTDAEIVAELTQVDAVIAPFVKDGKFLFRPPYGQFDDKTFAALDKSPMKKYVGPILWNIGGTLALPNQASDAECWTAGTPVEACGNAYLKEISNVGKGIVLLHDPYFLVQNNPDSGGTYQMIQYMVPKLKADGYKFVRVDEVPDVAALLPGGQSPDGGADAGTGNEPVPGSSGEGTSSDPLGTEPCP
jgi:peptidoglycan/xylan/chitin deacetylase (PgdA/CDA1 family)